MMGLASMLPRSPASLFRRRSFWAGLAILLIISAAWVNAVHRRSYIVWNTSKGNLLITHNFGRIEIEAEANRSGRRRPSSVHLRLNQPMKSGSPGWELPHVYLDRSAHLIIYIPYWLILATFLATWSSFLIWRTLSIRKHLGESSNQPRAT